jgi:hypothetical protein
MSIQAKALIQAVAMSLIAWAIYHFLHHRVMPIVIWSLAGLVLIGGLVYHPIFHGFERFGQLLAKWVSAGLTWGLLVPFFYLCFLPGRLVLHLRGIDPMDRRFPEKEKGTFWEPRPPVRNMAQYTKQH